jgi:hypothetical protein
MDCAEEELIMRKRLEFEDDRKQLHHKKDLGISKESNITILS